MKFDDTPSKEEREDFWLDLGPASAYEGLDCCETARRDGDAMMTRTVSRCPTCRPS